MFKKALITLGSTLLLTSSLLAIDLASTAKSVYSKAGGNKTESQWKRYFKKDKWLTKLGIAGLSEGDRASLLSYLNARSADKDQATVPQ